MTYPPIHDNHTNIKDKTNSLVEPGGALSYALQRPRRSGEDSELLMRLSRGFWDDYLRSRPEFPISEGMFAFDPAIRQRQIDVLCRTHSKWQRYAMDSGIGEPEFFGECTRVRAAMY